MFWEMDKSGHENDLTCISQYLLSFFDFASCTVSLRFYREEWLDFAGEDGRWLYGLYERDTGNGAAMRQAVRDLFSLPLSERRKIYRAIEHDMSFDKNRASGFEFLSVEPHLDQKQCGIIKDFFLYFYGVVLCSAHFRLKGLSQENFGRKELVRLFFEGANGRLRHICPVCLQPVTNAGREEDIEHYFGKAFVPCLALHPYNLYFACKACNQTYKGDNFPLQQGTDIRRVFLPYFDVIKEKTKVEFYHEEKADGLRLQPENENEPYIREKIEAFDRLFHLEERWSGMLETYYDSMRLRYTAEEPESFEALKREIRKDVTRAKAECRIRPERYVETQYQEWISQRRLRAFYSEMKHCGRTAVVESGE